MGAAKLREDALLKPLGFNLEGVSPDGVTNVLFNEHEKGFRNGLIFATQFPNMQIESDELDVVGLSEQITLEEEEEEDGSTDESWRSGL